MRRLAIDLPVRGEVSATASFVKATFDAQGNQLEELPDLSLTVTQADVAALPSFAKFYGELSTLLHARRNAFDA